MPRRITKSSSVRRRKLTDFVESFRDEIVKLYSTHIVYKRLYRVYIRSGKYSEYLRRS